MKTQKNKLSDGILDIGRFGKTFVESTKKDRHIYSAEEENTCLQMKQKIWKNTLLTNIYAKGNSEDFPKMPIQQKSATHKNSTAKKNTYKTNTLEIIHRYTLSIKPLPQTSILREDKNNYFSNKDKEKALSLGLISHELRTPLNSILVLSEQLCKNPENNLNEQQILYASAIKDSGHALLKILSEYIALSRINSNSPVDNNLNENHSTTLSAQHFSNLISVDSIKSAAHDVLASENQQIADTKTEERNEKDDKNTVDSKAQPHTPISYNNKLNKGCIIIFDTEINARKEICTKATNEGYSTLIAQEIDTLFDALHLSNIVAVFIQVKTAESLGWKAAAQIKNDFHFRHISIHISAPIQLHKSAINRGAIVFSDDPNGKKEIEQHFISISKMQNSKRKHLLLIDVRKDQMENLEKKFNIEGIVINAAKNIEHVHHLLNMPHDAILLIDHEAQEWGLEIRHHIEDKHPHTALLLHSTSIEKTDHTKQILHTTKQTYLEKRFSNDQLIDETLLLLKFNHTHLSKEKKRLLENIRMKNDMLSGKTILIVDDDVRNVFAINTVLERFNINVISADSGLAALNILRENKNIDMLLIDMLMPEMNGYETIQKLRHQNIKSNLPIIALTAMSMDGDKKKCLDAGANDYISKPIKMDLLLWKMRNFFLQ